MNLLLLIFCIAFQNECINPLIDDKAIVQVYSIVDGDTFKIKVKNDIFSIRILGLDCYETKRNKRLKEQAIKNNITLDSALYLGLEAKRLCDSLLTGKTVTILRDRKENNFDVYNRLLRKCLIDNFDYTDFMNKRGLNATQE